MTARHLLWIGLSIVVGPITAATAGDLALIAVTSEQQAELARQVCGSAYLRVEDQFLVEISSDGRDVLRLANVEVEDIMHNADVTALSLVLDRPAGAGVTVDLSAYGRMAVLPDGVRLLSISPSAASSLRSTTGLKITPLSEWQTTIEYYPPRAYWNLPAVAYPTDSLAGLINQDTLQALDQRLEAFYTRALFSDSINKARDWMVQRFLAWGYTNVTTPSFSWNGTHYNVQAIKTGYAEPNTFIVVGGHYDSRNDWSPYWVYAPGADDNASGTALTLELARVFSKIPTRKSIIFIPFSAEERGLQGSKAAATGYRNSGTNVECMFNFDMVGFVTDKIWKLDLSSGSNSAYRQITADAASRVTSIVPVTTAMGSSSDHYPFFQKGFDIVDHIEHDFNFDGWHTSLDVSSRMNFSYFTQVAKLAIASVAVTANAGKTANISEVVDNGDGQSATVMISGCHPSSTYWVRYGTAPTTLNDSLPVPAGACSASVTGLAQGTAYYFAVFESPADGYRSIWSTTSSQTPLSVPRVPNGLDVSPQAAQIDLVWSANKEGDIDHYKLYRRAQGLGDFLPIAGNVTGPAYTDTHVTPKVPYEYAVTAVDHDGNESAPSKSLMSCLATFDCGILLVHGDPGWFGTVPTTSIWSVDPAFSSGATRSDVARFSSIFWSDCTLPANTEVIAWYLSHPTNMLISQDHCLEKITQATVPVDHYLHTEFGLNSFTYVAPDFLGAKGQNGWPSMDCWGGPLNWVYNLVGVPGTTVIYTYDEDPTDPNNPEPPIGIAWDSPRGKRILLGFPLYRMWSKQIKALIAKAVEYFGESTTGATNGDLDGSGIVDISDLVMMIDFLYISFTPPLSMNGADVDHSCKIDISDITYLIEYLFMSGPTPQAGCVP